MNDWEEKLNALLSDPEAMAQVVGMAQTLSQQFGGGAPQSAVQSEPPGGGNPLGMLGNIDPALLTRLIPVLQQLNRSESSEASAFLYALRPFLKPSRRDKVDRACQLARIIHLAKTFLTTQEG